MEIVSVRSLMSFCSTSKKPDAEKTAFRWFLGDIVGTDVFDTRLIRVKREGDFFVPPARKTRQKLVSESSIKQQRGDRATTIAACI